MIKEVDLKWLEDEKSQGRKHWIGRYRNINYTPPVERYFIGKDENELTKYLDTLIHEVLIHTSDIHF